MTNDRNKHSGSTATHPSGKVLILHIGDHKTGTTTLQNHFATGRIDVKGAGVLYPGNLNHNYLLGHFRVDMQQPSGWAAPFVGLFRREEVPPVTPGNQARPGLDMLRSMIAASDAKYVVISGEEFENMVPRNMRYCVDRWFRDLFDEVRIIAYVRPHAARFLSNYAELIKIGEVRGDLDDYLERIRYAARSHFAQRFLRWRHHFGDELILRPMVRSRLLNGSVVDDFAATAFAGEDVTIVPSTTANESLGLRELMVLKYIQERFDLDTEERFRRHTMARELTRYLNEFTTGTEPTGKLTLHRSVAEKVYKVFCRDAQVLDQEFFANDPMFFDDLAKSVQTAKDQPISLEPRDYFAAEELRRMGVLREVLWNMMQTNKNWANFFHENRVRALHNDDGKRNPQGMTGNGRRANEN